MEKEDKIICEIGINHEGIVENALTMIRQAKHAGADFVKFQKRNPDICVPEEYKNDTVIFNNKRMTYLEQKKILEFDTYDYNIIDNFCGELNIKWFASVFDIDSLKFISRYKSAGIIKIPSSQICNIELLTQTRKVALKNKLEVFISTGASELSDIQRAVELLGETLTVIFHTTSIYPCPDDTLDLTKITELQKMFPDKNIGYSNHYSNGFPAIVAKTLGATYFEFHVQGVYTKEICDNLMSLTYDNFCQICSILKKMNYWNGEAIFKAKDEELAKLRKQQYFLD